MEVGAWENFSYNKDIGICKKINYFFIWHYLGAVQICTHLSTNEIKCRLKFYLKCII